MKDLSKILGNDQSNLTILLMSIKGGTPIFSTYYVAGTLCIDIENVNKDNQPIKMTIMINLDETVGWMMGGSQVLMNTKNCILAFEIYLQEKSNNVYFKSCLSKSHVRHLQEFTNKRYKLVK